MEEIESAFTEPVSVESARDTVMSQATIGLADPLLRVLGTPRVKVTASVRERRATRKLRGLELQVRGGAPGTVRATRVDVTVAGPASALERLEAGAIIPYVDLARAAAGRVPVAAEVAPGHAGRRGAGLRAGRGRPARRPAAGRAVTGDTRRGGPPR